MKLLAIDIGASGGRAVMGEFSDARLQLCELRRFHNGMVEVGPHKHWDVLRLFEEVKACLAEARDAAGAGIDTWGVDYGYVGRDGDLLGLPFAYRDLRTGISVQHVHDVIPPDELYRLTGIQFMPFNTIYQVADDLASRPWLVENSHKLLMMPELLGFLLTGEAVAEYTNASTTGFLDPKNRKWSREVLTRIGFPGEKLADVCAPGAVRVLLKEGTRRERVFVFTACHDTGSAVAGIPAEGEDWAFISAGTWFLVGTELDAPVVSEEARAFNFTNEGGVGGKIRFLTNVTGLWLVQELRRLYRREGLAVDYPRMCADAERALPLRSLVNPQDPSFLAPADMREAIAEFCRKTGQDVPEGVGAMSRCAFESVALACRRAVAQLKQVTGRTVSRLHVVGGGVRNRLLCQMIADACGVPVIAGPEEATSVGNLLVQAIAHGYISALAEGRALVAKSFAPVHYAPRDTGRWDAAAERFDKL